MECRKPGWSFFYETVAKISYLADQVDARIE